MENKDWHYYISHYGDFSPVNLKIEKIENFNHNFIFMSSEKSDDIKQVVNNEKINKKNFTFKWKIQTK